MDVSATLRHVRISPLKLRWVVDQIRGLPVAKALDVLTFSVKKGGKIAKKVLQSAIANAENNHGADVDELRITKAYVNEGSRYKRTMARAKGRANRILKRTAHLTLVVSDMSGEK